MSQARRFDSLPAFQLKGSLLAITVLELEHNDLQQLDLQLAARVDQAPQFFSNTPVIVALDRLPENERALNLGQLVSLCRQYGLHPLAVRTPHELHIREARLAGLPVLPPSGSRPRPPEQPPASPEPAAPEAVLPPAEVPAARPARIISHPVRSGQQVYAQGGDLIVLAPVSPGAEILADGNIHVYAPLRGRALAGIKGDSSARIFCQRLSAELLSIAGQYKVAEDLRREPLWGTATQISLSGHVLNIAPL